MGEKRLAYIDICKSLAIFLVTWSHCAQCVSGMIWTNFLGGRQLDLAFTMPLFMLMSGWFIDLDKMRNSSVSSFVSSKFKRLIIPSIVWYFALLVLTFNLPDSSIFSYYWYLDALFVCLCVIMMCSKLIKNNLLCSVVSTIFVLVVPYSDYSHINFMMPFLWAGYGLHKILKLKYSLRFIILCFIIGLILYTKWDKDYSVYSSPFIIWDFNLEMVLIMFYRFILGLTISSVIIYCILKKEMTRLRIISQFGSYSLVIYTSSLACLGIVSRVFDYLQIHTNRYGLIDLLSLFLSFLIIVITIRFADFCRKRKLLRQLCLGE